jgi:hypothetical protein
VTAECAVYLQGQKRSLEHRLNGEDEDDPSVVLDDIHNSFEEAKEMIMAGAEKFGIDLDDIPEEYFDEEERRHETLINDPMYCRASDFTKQAREFLKTIDPLVDGDSRAYYEDINWHHTIVSAKVFRAVGGDENEYRDEDSRNSAAVAVKSLTICGMALDELAARFPDISEACGKLGSMASLLKIDIRLRWLSGQ